MHGGHYTNWLRDNKVGHDIVLSFAGYVARVDELGCQLTGIESDSVYDLSRSVLLCYLRRRSQGR